MSADHPQKDVTPPTGQAGKPVGFQLKILLLSLLLLGLVGVSCAILIIQAGSSHSQQRLADSLTAQLPGVQARYLDMTVFNHTFRDLQYRLTALSALLVFTLVGGIFIMVRKVAKPIDEIGQAAESITGGHLDVVLPDHTFMEITKVGSLIQDLAMNLQEVLLLTWNHTVEQRESLQRLADVLAQTGNGTMAPECRAEIADLSRKVENMRAMVRAFDFYDVRLSEATLLSASDSEASAAP